MFNTDFDQRGKVGKMKLSTLAATMVVLASAAGSAQAGMKYECWTYVGGSPDKMISRVADNNSEAVKLATEWFSSNGYKFDYVKCK